MIKGHAANGVLAQRISPRTFRSHQLDPCGEFCLANFERLFSSMGATGMASEKAQRRLSFARGGLCAIDSIDDFPSGRPTFRREKTALFGRVCRMTNNIAPVISVIIPVRNEARFLDRCLHSLFSADPVAAGIEVLVVDGMSEDGTRKILEDWSSRQPGLRVLDNRERITPTAMNLGIRAARGAWILIAGAHCTYPPDFFRLCLETAQRTQADNVGGEITTLTEEDGAEGTLVRAITTHRFGVGNAGCRVGATEGWADTVAYSCYRREVFDRIGLYDERLPRNQDYEFNRRLLKAGGRIWRNPAICNQYYNQGSLKGLLRQAFRTGQWNPWMWYLAPYSFAWRHAVPLVFVTALAVGLALTLTETGVGLTFLGLILVPYFTLAIVAAGQQALRYGLWSFAILPFLFFAYHVSYGGGGLWAMVLLALRRAPVQRDIEPWPGAGSGRAWPRPGIVTD
jgi:glycosyltransferase involved in cell wall biosynthesis